MDNVVVSAYGGTENNTGIGNYGGYKPSKIWFRGGRIYGETDGVNVPNATVYFVNTEVFSTRYAVFAKSVRIGSTWLRGSGAVVGVTATCAGVFDAFTFYPNSCP